MKATTTIAGCAVTACLAAAAAGLGAIADGSPIGVATAVGATNAIANILAGPAGSQLGDFFRARDSAEVHRANHDLRHVLERAIERAALHTLAEYFPDQRSVELVESTFPRFVATQDDDDFTGTNRVKRWLIDATRQLLDDGMIADPADVVAVLDLADVPVEERFLTYFSALDGFPRVMRIDRHGDVHPDEATGIAFRVFLGRRFPEVFAAYILIELKPGDVHADRARWLIEQAYLQTIWRRSGALDAVVRINKELWSPRLLLAYESIEERCRNADPVLLLTTVDLLHGLLSIAGGDTRACLRTALECARGEDREVWRFEEVDTVVRKYAFSNPSPSGAFGYSEGLTAIIARAEELIAASTNERQTQQRPGEICFLHAIFTLDHGVTMQILEAAGLERRLLLAALQLHEARRLAKSRIVAKMEQHAPTEDRKTT